MGRKYRGDGAGSKGKREGVPEGDHAEVSVTSYLDPESGCEVLTLQIQSDAGGLNE